PTACNRKRISTAPTTAQTSAFDSKPTFADSASHLLVDASAIHLPLGRLPALQFLPKIGSRKQFLRRRKEEVGVPHARGCRESQHEKDCGRRCDRNLVRTVCHVRWRTGWG